MKTAISIPDDIFEEAERLSKRLGIPRSRLYALAVASYLGEHKNKGITEALDEIYASEKEDSGLNPELNALQLNSLTEEQW